MVCCSATRLKFRVAHQRDFRVTPQRVAGVIAVPDIHDHQHLAPRIPPDDVEHQLDEVRDMASPRAPRRLSSQRRNTFVEQIGDEVVRPCAGAAPPAHVQKVAQPAPPGLAHHVPGLRGRGRQSPEARPAPRAQRRSARGRDRQLIRRVRDSRLRLPGGVAGWCPGQRMGPEQGCRGWHRPHATAGPGQGTESEDPARPSLVRWKIQALSVASDRRALRRRAHRAAVPAALPMPPGGARWARR